MLCTLHPSSKILAVPLVIPAQRSLFNRMVLMLWHVYAKVRSTVSTLRIAMVVSHFRFLLPWQCHAFNTARASLGFAFGRIEIACLPSSRSTDKNPLTPGPRFHRTALCVPRCNCGPMLCYICSFLVRPNNHAHSTKQQ